MELRPLYDRVIVKRSEDEQKTAKGLFLPESSKEKPQQGMVLAVGHGKLSDEGKLRPLAVKAGDKVLFGRHAGTDVKVDGEDRLVLREDEILGIVD